MLLKSGVLLRGLLPSSRLVVSAKFHFRVAAVTQQPVTRKVASTTRPSRVGKFQSSPKKMRSDVAARSSPCSFAEYRPTMNNKLIPPEHTSPGDALPRRCKRQLRDGRLCCRKLLVSSRDVFMTLPPAGPSCRPPHHPTQGRPRVPL